MVTGPGGAALGAAVGAALGAAGVAVARTVAAVAEYNGIGACRTTPLYAVLTS